MPRLSRQESQARTRATLVDTARRLFVAEGMTATSLEQVAEEAGYSRGAVYSNFRTKGELCLEVLDQIHNERLAEIAAALAGPGTLPDRLERLRSWAQDALGDVGWTMLEFEIAIVGRTDSHVGARLATNLARWRQATRHMLGSALHIDGITAPAPIDLLADAILGLGIGASVQRAVDPQIAAETFDDAVRLLIDPPPHPGQLNVVQDVTRVGPGPGTEQDSSRLSGRRSAASRDAMLEAARELFDQVGYEQASVAQIAAAAGVAVGTINYHFGSKRGLYLAVLEALQESLWDQLQQLRGPARERLMDGLDLYLEMAQRHPRLFQSFSGDDDVQTLHDRYRDRLLAALTTELTISPTPALVTTAVHGWLGFLEYATADWVRGRSVSREQLRDLLAANLQATGLAVLTAEPSITPTSRAIAAVLNMPAPAAAATTCSSEGTQQ